MVNELPANISKAAIYKPSEVARILGVNYTTIWRWMNSSDPRRQLRHGTHRHNGRPFIKGQEIIRFFNAEA